MADQPPPSEKLAEALKQYSHELEALRQSLEDSMMLFQMMSKSHSEEMLAFARKHGTDTHETDEGLKFKIPSGKTTDFDRIERRVKNVDSARKLIPRYFLVGLVCTYDAFFGKLLRFIFEAKPELLDSSERTLTYSEILALDSITTAKESLIEKEIETVLRKSHVEHFKWLESKLSTPFNKSLKSWPFFVELTERRNLFAHTDGVISTQYLTVCGQYKCELPDDRKLGTTLNVPQSYFREACTCLHEMGIKLAHVVWRKLCKGEMEAIDQNLCDITYDLIETTQYEVAIRVLEFFTQDKMEHTNDAFRRTMLINLAQAHKWNKQNDLCQKILLENDWSAADERFKLATRVLKEEWEAAFASMRTLAHDPHFRPDCYREWPLFKGLRKHAEFSKVFEECYHRPFGKTEEIKSQPSTEADATTQARSEVPSSQSASKQDGSTKEKIETHEAQCGSEEFSI